MSTCIQQPSALVSWSGGKDSCLAYWRASRSGVPVRRLVTAMEESGARSRSHGVSPQLLQAQADALGVDIRFFSASWKNYEERFAAALRAARHDGITHAVFGDIDLPAHREWEERICAATGMSAWLPLWEEPRERLVREFLADGFRAVVVCVNAAYLGAEFCGREYDAAFLADLPEGVDACGENGEFHTFAYDGPAFARAVGFRRGAKVRHQAPAELGGLTYHFQDLLPA